MTSAAAFFGLSASATSEMHTDIPERNAPLLPPQPTNISRLTTNLNGRHENMQAPKASIKKIRRRPWNLLINPQCQTFRREAPLTAREKGILRGVELCLLCAEPTTSRNSRRPSKVGGEQHGGRRWTWRMMMVWMWMWIWMWMQMQMHFWRCD